MNNSSTRTEKILAKVKNRLLEVNICNSAKKYRNSVDL